MHVLVKKLLFRALPGRGAESPAKSGRPVAICHRSYGGLVGLGLLEGVHSTYGFGV